MNTTQRNYYFVDYENVHSGGLSGIEKLSENDTVYIFYSEACSRLPMNILNGDIFARIKTIAVNPGKQALDIQMSSYIGFSISEGKGESEAGYMIVSNDTDFDRIVSFWRLRGFENIRRVTSVDNTAPEEICPTDETQAGQTDFEAITGALKAAGINYPDRSIVLSCIRGNLAKNGYKSRIHGDIVKNFGPITGLAYYNSVKPYI